MTTRRAPFSPSTKETLIQVAESLFTDHGYAGTSLDAIVAGAAVTKGALYHHFTGKQGLFEAVFDRLELEASRRVEAGLSSQQDPWLKADAGLRAFMSVLLDPSYRRIVVQEGPAVLGHHRFREREEQAAFASIAKICRDVLAAGSWELDDEMVQTFSQIFFGAITAAGQAVADSPEPAKAKERGEAAISFVLAGVQQMVAAGLSPWADSGH